MNVSCMDELRLQKEQAHPESAFILCLQTKPHPLWLNENKCDSSFPNPANMF